MAQNNENLSNFIDQKAWSDFERLEKVIASAADSMEYLSLTAQEAFKGLNNAATLQQLVDLMNKAKVSTDGLGESNTKLKTGIKELNAEQLKSNLSIKERNDLLKLQVQYEAAPVNSIAKMRAEIRLLTAEYNKLDLEKQKDLANNKKLELDAKNATLKSSVDAYTAQKINIGNYPELIMQAEKLKEEMNALEQSGQKDTTEFKNLSGALGSVTSAMGGASGQLTWVIGEMNTLASAGQKDSAEFQRLATYAAELKVQMEEVKIAIAEAGASSERSAVAIEKFTDTLKELGKFALEFFGVQLGLEFLGGISEEFGKADDAANQLKNTLQKIDATGAFGKLNEEAEEVHKTLKYIDEDDVKVVFDKLITYGKLTEDQINKLLPVIIDFSAKEKVTIAEGAETIIKAMEGSARALKSYGINIKEATAETETAASPAERLALIMEKLKPRVEGAAQAFNDNWGGKVAGWKVWFIELEKGIARFFIKLAGIEEQEQRNAIAAKQEATETQALVDEYEALSKKVDITADEKKRLTDITATLANTFGDSVVEIDKETGALKLNVEATKELIKQRMLLANNRASELALKYNDASEKLNKNVEQTLLHQRIIKDLQQTAGTDAKINDEFQKVARLRSEWQLLKRDQVKALSGLNELGFNEDDINRLFHPGEIKPVDDLSAGGKDKKIKDNKVDNEKALSAAMFSIWEEETKRKAAQLKEIADDENESYEARKEALLKYQALQSQISLGKISNEYGDKQFESTHIKAEDNETAESVAQRKQTALAELQAIEEKYNTQQLEDAKAQKDALKTLDENYLQHRLKSVDQVEIYLQDQQTKELLSLRAKYDRGKIDYKQYQDALLQMDQKYQMAKMLLQEALYKELLKEFAPDSPQYKQLQKLISEVDHAIAKLKSDYSDSSSENPLLSSLGINDEQWAKAQKVANNIMDLEGQIIKLADQKYAKEIANLEMKRTLIDANYAAEINAIQGGMMSQQKKDVFISQLKAQQMQQDKAINEEIGRQKRKQAQADKVAAISGAIEKGVVAVVNALDTQPVWLGIAMAAIVGATVAAQVATAANTPLPQYGEGTGHLPGGVHAGGDAIVGERNKPEYIFKPGERTAQMVNRATKMSLPRGTRVLTEEQLIRDSVDMLPDAMLYGGGMHGVMEHVMMDGMQDLKGEISQLNDTVKNKHETHFHWDNGELRKSIKRGNDWTDYLNSNFN